jgi:hypothetical protein
MQEEIIETKTKQEQPIAYLEMEYLQATAELTPWMIHLRMHGDGRYIYRVSGLSAEEDPTVYFDIDSFTLSPDESEPITLTEDSVPVQDIAIWNCRIGKSDISFYFWNKTAYSIHFPLKWAIQESYGSRAFGTKVCGICEKYGFQDGIFLGYCADCAEKCREQEKEKTSSLEVSL